MGDGLSEKAKEAAESVTVGMGGNGGMSMRSSLDMSMGSSIGISMSNSMVGMGGMTLDDSMGTHRLVFHFCVYTSHRYHTCTVPGMIYR